jgi:hypothetical protein
MPFGARRGVGGSNCKVRLVSLAKVDNPVTRSSGEKTPTLGMLQSRSSTRPLADRRSCRNGGKGKAIPSKWILRKRGVDPHKNVPGRTGGDPLVSIDLIRMLSSAGNGSCITPTIDPSIELVTTRSISHTRSG